MSNMKEEQPRKESLLNRLTEHARAKFLGKEIYDPNADIIESYCIFMACRDTIAECDIEDPLYLLPELIRTSSVPPL